MRFPASSAIVLPFVILAASCGTSGGGGKEIGGLDGDQGGIGTALAPYVSLDLESRALVRLKDPGDLASDGYRTTKVLFRRITGFGSADYYIGVFELTQGQWSVLTSGARPWSSIDSSVIQTPYLTSSPSTSAEAARPAYNLSHELVVSVLNAWNLGGTSNLQLPTSGQWRFACAGGTSTTWAFGSTSSDASTYANVWETRPASAPRGPDRVGLRQPNQFGLFDMHGNVWEWTAAGTHIVGGSWHDRLYQARTANLAGVDDPQIDTSTSHALIGARLVLVP